MVRTTQRRGLLLFGVLALVTLTTAFVSESAHAVPTGQMTQGNNPPPEVGAVVFTDTAFSVFGSVTCPSGRNKRELVGEGYIFKVTGKCSETSPTAGIGARVSRVVFPDGEARLDFKIVSGHDLARVTLGFREQPQSASYADYQAVVVPALNSVALYRNDQTLADRQALIGVVSQDDWNTLAVRARGSELWVLLNDQLVLQANDATHDRGLTYFALQRLGDVNDEPETAVVIRNLRIASLANGDPSRVPTIQQE